MINNAAFTGRETMLTKGIKKAVAAHDFPDYIGSGTIFPKKEAKAIEELANKAKKTTNNSPVYTSPFASTGANSPVNTGNNKDYLSYAVSHGAPEAEALTRIDFLA